MKVTDLRASHFTEPLGMGLSPLSLSWVTEDTKSKKQEAAQIKIWTEEGPVYDSGRQKTISSLGFEPALVLLPRTRYFWNVTVWGDAGDSGSAQSWFETAKEGEGISFSPVISRQAAPWNLPESMPVAWVSMNWRSMERRPETNTCCPASIAMT